MPDDKTSVLRAEVLRYLPDDEIRKAKVMSHPGWTLIAIGLLIVGIGVVWLLAPNIPWLGRLPGDIVIDREHFKFYFPLTTCLVLSALLSLVMWLVRRLSS